MNDTINEIAFQIILHAGNGKSSAMEAIQEAKTGNFEAVEQKLIEANDEIKTAHGFQTKLLQDEAKGTEKSITVILIHAQDHLMTAMTVRDLALEIIELHRHK